MWWKVMLRKILLYAEVLSVINFERFKNNLINSDNIYIYIYI